MEYTNIKNQLIAEYEGFKNNHEKYIMEGDENRVNAYSTNTRWRQYKAGIISLEELKQFAVERNARKYKKELEKKLAFLERIENAGTVESFTIRVEWRKSSVWGYNPYAEVDVMTNDGWKRASGSASGCGYDKRSAAVGSALSSLDCMIKILCDMKEEAIKNGADPVYDSSDCGTNSKYIGYGSGHGAIPYFEGGVGYNCFDRIFILAGFNPVVRDESGKHSDYYYYIKK